ncbi:HPP family protein, partial [Pseudomonas sp. K5002]|nr:HPP family protein [Pseudomonas sp. K5002]
TALLACALAYNNATRTRYPKGTREPAAPIFMPIATENPGISAEDLKQALAEREQFLDVTPQELEELIQASERYARRRTIGAVFQHQGQPPP